MPDSFDNLTEAIVQLAHELKDLEHRAITVYEPIVNAIVASDSTDVGHIGRKLDGLLGFAGSEDVLRLFKSLCRHYWQIAPAATASYVHSYRDM